jgi:hypothetical protein
MFSAAIALQLRGVGHSPASVASMLGTDSASWNNKRPAGVALSFQVRKHVVEAHADVPSNVFSNDPSGPEFSHEPTKFRPEVAVIFFASALPGSGEWLAWVSAANNVNWPFNVRSFQGSDVWEARHVRPVLPQDSAGKRFVFTEGDGLKSARPFKAKAETAYAAEQVQNAQLHRIASAKRCRTRSGLFLTVGIWMSGFLVTSEAAIHQRTVFSGQSSMIDIGRAANPARASLSAFSRLGLRWYPG